MSNYGTSPDYDRYLDSMMEAQFAETDAYEAWCEENDYDPANIEETHVPWEEFKRADMESQLRDEEMLAERFEMELRDGE